jgi:sigma-B regulation protein RsbU (phosphoserine phosphatase)
MRSLFQSRPVETAPIVEPVRTEFPKIDGAEMAAVFFGKRVAGDFYDALRVSPERILFGLLDVAGRREDNRGILSAAQRIFRDLGTGLFAKPDSNESEAMTELCILLNRGIMEAAGEVRSCPAFLACYHEHLGTLCYTNAGHTPGLLRDNTGIAELGPTGLPLGLFSHATSDSPTIGLEKGAVLLLVSRGVIEGKCAGGKAEEGEFGLDRVKESLQNNHSHHAEEICASILKDVCEFTDAPPVHNDVTALAFTRAL